MPTTCCKKVRMAMANVPSYSNVLAFQPARRDEIFCRARVSASLLDIGPTNRKRAGPPIRRRFYRGQQCLGSLVLTKVLIDRVSSGNWRHPRHRGRRRQPPNVLMATEYDAEAWGRILPGMIRPQCMNWRPKPPRVKSQNLKYFFRLN